MLTRFRYLLWYSWKRLVRWALPVFTHHRYPDFESSAMMQYVPFAIGWHELLMPYGRAMRHALALTFMASRKAARIDRSIPYGIPEQWEDLQHLLEEISSG